MKNCWLLLKIVQYLARKMLLDINFIAPIQGDEKKRTHCSRSKNKLNIIRYQMDLNKAVPGIDSRIKRFDYSPFEVYRHRPAHRFIRTH